MILYEYVWRFMDFYDFVRICRDGYGFVWIMLVPFLGFS